jgi:hypothetical protein
MTNADRWARVVQARTAREDLRVGALHKGEHEAAIDVKVVPGIGAEIAIADTRAMFEAERWARFTSRTMQAPASGRCPSPSIGRTASAGGTACAA